MNQQQYTPTTSSKLGAEKENINSALSEAMNVCEM